MARLGGLAILFLIQFTSVRKTEGLGQPNVPPAAQPPEPPQQLQLNPVQQGHDRERLYTLLVYDQCPGLNRLSPLTPGGRAAIVRATQACSLGYVSFRFFIDEDEQQNCINPREPKCRRLCGFLSHPVCSFICDGPGGQPVRKSIHEIVVGYVRRP